MNWTIQKKLYCSFGGVLVLMAAVGLAGWRYISNLAAEVQTMFETNVKATVYLSDTERALWELRFGIGNYLTADAEQRARINEESPKWKKQFEDGLSAYVAIATSEKEKELVARLRESMSDYFQARPQFFALLDSGKSDEGKAFRRDKTNPPAAKSVATLKELIEFQKKTAETNDKDALAMANRSVTVLIAFLAVALTIGAVIIVWMNRSITAPLAQTVSMFKDVAQGEGDLTARLEVNSSDEVGQVCMWFNTFVEKLEATIRSIRDNIKSLTSAAEQLTSVSHQMNSNSEETAAQANVVSAASEQVSKSVGTVAAGAEEMGASIKEIGKNTSEAARVAKEAVEVAEKTNQMITQLGQSSAEIGNVIKVITSIAEQTNLLALNATIEAARAGEAGKGFAVVANEVKELAKQTGQATEDISHKIGAIQHDTQVAVAAIQQIGEIINHINEIANSIAAAIEEQSVTTSEMSRNLGEAARGSHEIVQNIVGVARAAQNTASGATETQAAAQELARLATELRTAVKQFKVARNSESRSTPSKEGTANPLSGIQPQRAFRPVGATLHTL